jgi:hypothetical protein
MAMVFQRAGDDMSDYWSGLMDRVQYLRDLYKQNRIPLKPGEGLTVALDEAEATAKRVASSDAPTEENFLKSANACHAVWNLHEVVEACISAGLDVADHLRQLTTGTLDYGIPADAVTSNKTIFFKDFEAELLVASRLGKAGLPVQFFQKSNDPRGEMHVNNIFIEVKHPNSAKRVERLMRDFNGELHRAGTYGVFVTAVEDAFCLADQSTFPSQEDFLAWQRQKRAEIESFGRGVVLRAVTLPRIAAIVQTSSMMEVVGDETKFARYSNSLVFDQRQYPPEALHEVERIAAVFNPQFRRYTQIQHILVPNRSI